MLYELGLEAAVEWLAEQFQAQHGLRIEVDDDGQPKEVEDNVRALVYRAVRELLLNAIKHAQAQNARVSLRREDDKLHVEVADDGRGFDPTAGNAEDLSGFGLFSIHERMDFIGGSFQIDSAPGQGTRGVVAVPLKHEEASPGGE